MQWGDYGRFQVHLGKGTMRGALTGPASALTCPLDGSRSAPRDREQGNSQIPVQEPPTWHWLPKRDEAGRSFTHLRTPVIRIGDGISQSLCLTTTKLSPPTEHLSSITNVLGIFRGTGTEFPQNVACYK